MPRFVYEFSKFATKLDGFRAVVWCNLNKTLKWNEMFLSCLAERRKGLLPNGEVANFPLLPEEGWLRGQ